MICSVFHPIFMKRSRRKIWRRKLTIEMIYYKIKYQHHNRFLTHNHSQNLVQEVHMLWIRLFFIYYYNIILYIIINIFIIFFIAVSNSLLSPVSPSMEVYMCTRSTPGSITYEKCDHISTIDYTKVSSTKKFILQETHSAPLLSDIEGSQCRGQKTEQGKS